MTPADAGGARPAVLVLIATAFLLGAVAPAATGTQTATERPAAEATGATAFVVALAEDGDATVTLRLTFDLDREAERRALAQLRENRSAVAAGFEERLGAVAARTAEATGREMRITAADVSVSTDGETGVVELSATWVGLAAVEGDRLVVRAPFADGFEPPGRFEVRAPEGYELATTTPAPTTTADSTASWEAGTSLEGFEAAFVPADASNARPLPGFGAPAAIAALALGAGVSVLAARRRA